MACRISRTNVAVKIQHPEPETVINHCVIFDNYELQQFTNDIAATYPLFLDRHMQRYKFNQISLVTSYPEYKCQIVYSNGIYRAFRQIHRSNKISTYKTDHLINLLNTIKNTITYQNKNPFELILITNFANPTNKHTHELLQTIADMPHVSISIITLENNLINDTLKDLPNTKVFAYDKTNSFEVFLHLTYNTIFPPCESISITLQGAKTIDHTKTISLSQHHRSFVAILKDHKQQHIIVNNKKIKVDNKSNIDLLTYAVEYAIESLKTNYSRNKYEQVKDILHSLAFNANANAEMFSRTEVLKVYLRHILHIIRLTQTQELPTSSSMDITPSSIITDYTKQSEVHISNKRQQHKLNETILNNTDLLDQLKNLPTIAKQNLITEQNQKFIKSTEFFDSVITLSNWHDELELSGCMGLVVKASTSSLVKVGVNYGVNIENVTTTFIPVLDCINAMQQFFEDRSDFGNLNDKLIIKGNAIGNGNSVIPLYICKQHWNVAKELLKPVLGITFVHHPLGYLPQHDQLLFVIYNHMIQMTFNSTNFNERWVQVLIAVQRTCAEIAFMHKYNRGIRGYFKRYITDPTIRVSTYCDKIIGQTITTGFLLSNEQMSGFIKYTIEEMIRRYMNGETEFLTYLRENPKLTRTRFNKFIQEMERVLNHDLVLLIAYRKMNTIMKKLIETIGSFNKYIQLLEENYGLLP